MTSGNVAPGDAQRSIDEAQRKLDLHDGKVDGAIDQKEGQQPTPEDREKLTRAYIARVNEFQGRIAEVRRSIDVAKNTRGEWQALERACNHAERGLLECLAKIDPQTMHAAVDAFDAQILALTEELRVPTGQPVEAPNAAVSQKKTPEAPAVDSLRKAREAVRDKTTELQAQIDALNTKVIMLMQRMVDDTKGLQYGWTDTFKDFLRLSLKVQTAGIVSGSIDGVLPDRFAIADKNIQDLVDQIKGAREEMKKLSEQKQTLEGTGTTLDITLAAAAAEEARLAGRTEEYDRRMTLLLERYGEGLQGVDPAFAKRAMESAQCLRDQKKLSPFEEALIFGDARSPQALRLAVEQKLSESGSIDLLDQVRARQTFRAGPFVAFAPKFVAYHGHDASPAIRSGKRTTLVFSNGRALDVIVTSQAQKVLESIPKGKEPVLLRPVSSMQLQTEGAGRGLRLVLKNPPSDFIIQHTDIGFADAEGTILRDDQRTPIDLSTYEHRSTVEAQLRNQKGFRLDRYAPKLPLRTAENKPYPYGLYTLKTQSGVSVEGVTVAKDAIDLVNADPPSGTTLVLKRIPRPIELRAPDSERYGRGARQYQRVLQTDMIRREDLAYAKINDQKLETADINGRNAASVDISQAEKEQEEKTRDIQRVLDKHPAIHGVKQVASTVEQTVGRLQKFLEAGQTGSARESFVKFAREEAKPTLELLKNQQLRRDVDEAKSALLALKGNNGVALGGLEQQIDAQLKALDGFTAMLSDGRAQNLLETIMDASKFDADTWANFFVNELPVIVASIVVACAAAALVVVTMGGAAPLIAVSASTLFFTTAGATALGGVIGAELGKEAVYQGRRIFDSRVRSGEATFTERSKILKYAEGKKQFNEQTGQYEEQEFFRDVGNPLAKDFALGFATTVATMGLGNIVGGQLSRFLQNSKVIERLTARSDVLKAVTRKLANLNQNKEALEKATGLKDAISRALKSLPKEVGEEFGDEAQEHVLERFLNQLDVSLSASDAAVDGKLGLGALAGVLLAIGKNVRVGKSTITYRADANDSKAFAARVEAIRLEAESMGGTVTDLGRGVLSVRRPVEVNGRVEFETVQLMPEWDQQAEADASARQTPRKNLSPESEQTTSTQLSDIISRGRQVIPSLREACMKESDPEKKAKAEKDLAKAEKILAGLESGKVTMQDYEGIRDLGKVLKFTIAEQEVLARKILENSGVKITDVIRMDDEKSVGPARRIDAKTEKELSQIPCRELAKQGTLDALLPALEQAVDDPNPLAAMVTIVERIPNPQEQMVLRELLTDVRSFKSEALTDRERAIIFRESMEYLHDYEQALASGGFADRNPTVQDVFLLLQDNQRKLAHQTIVDRKFLTGSDHGVLHVIEADMRGAMKMADQLKGVLTPEARVLLHQATIDHDMGYTLNTLDETNNYFSQTKDHPLYSGIRTTETWQTLEQFFGPRVREIYHTAVLDHSDVGKQPLQELVAEIRNLHTQDPEYQKKHLELQGRLVRKILALADCSGTTADIKMMSLFMEPELVGKMGQLKDLDIVRQPLKKQLEGLPGDASVGQREELAAQLGAIDRIAYEIHQQMMDMVAERYTVNGVVVEPGASYVRALVKNFNATDPSFAVNRDFGSHAASFEGLTLVQDRPSLTYGVNDNFPLIRDRLGDKTAVSALTKAMDDFGLDLSKNPKCTVNGVEHPAYGIQQFAIDLANVYAGNTQSIVIESETLQGTFTFVKTESARSRELAEGVNRTLRREAAVRSAIEVLEDPEKSHDDRVLAISDLGRHFDESYVVQGRPALELIIAARTKLKTALTSQERKDAAEEVTNIIRTVKYQGRGVLQKPKKPIIGIEKKAA